MNRYTIEIFDNIGGTLFPFQRVEGAQIMKGAVSTHACAEFEDMIAFIGGGRNESLGVYIAQSSQAVKISTSEIDRLLAEYDESELLDIRIDVKVDQSHSWVMFHLPNRTMVYDYAASQALGVAVWFFLTSEPVNGRWGVYRGQFLVWCYDKWYVADPLDNNVGYLDKSIGSHWGQAVQWEVSTPIFYNQNTGAVFHDLELVALNNNSTSSATVKTSHSFDGQNWSDDAEIPLASRLCWRRQGRMRQYRLQRFQSNSNAHLTLLALEARLEPLMF